MENVFFALELVLHKFAPTNCHYKRADQLKSRMKWQSSKLKQSRLIQINLLLNQQALTHVTRWQQNYNMVGYGHVYQSRFKSFPLETDEHFYQVNRYVERNALRANLVERAEDWPFGSLWIREHGTEEDRKLLSAWPLPIPKTWKQHVNKPASESELGALRHSVVRGTPYGSTAWIESTARKLGLEPTLRKPGRPKKK